MADVGLLVAFAAGLVSFLSPCILPLVPGFMAYLGGSSLEESPKNRKSVFLSSVFFVLGFTAVFASLGVLLNTALEAVAYDVQLWLSRMGGVIIIFFGLYLTGLLKVRFLEKERKLRVTRKFRSRHVTSFAFGAAFAAGWTPCVGAVLGAILGLSVTQPGSAFALLAAYSAGLGVPFLLVGLFAARSSKLINRYAYALPAINRIFGVVLIALGVLVFTQQLPRIANLELLMFLEST